jgi:hypothetical protein
MSPFEVKVARHRNRYDTVEVVDLDDMEVVLFWDCTPRQASRMAEAIRADLIALEPEDFMARWAAASPEQFG